MATEPTPTDPTADDTLSLDLQDLTIEEIEMLEDLLDAPMEDLFKPGMRKGRLLRAFAFIVRRRQDPSFTLEDAGKLKVTFKESTLDPTGASAP